MGRADLSTPEIMTLQKAGCQLIYFGLESGSDQVLNGINKGIESQQISEFIRTLYEYGIMPAPSVFVGSPDETEEDFKETMRFILNHQKYLNFINLYPLRLTPGSDFTIENKKAGQHTENRLNEMVDEFASAGLHVCVGEQCAEYVLFHKVCQNLENC
jgi:radical SAM superfamily enzyme YgiQ (UPF0313 family)